jgi:hypothetical protein
MSSWQETAVQLRDEGKQYPQIAQFLKETYGEILLPEAIRAVYRRTKAQQRIQKERITFENMKQTTDDDVEAFIDAMVNLQDVQDSMDTKQVEGTITLDDDKPVGIAFWGDWHDGGKGVNYRLLESDRQTILATEGLYVAGTGDYKDNYISGVHPGAAFGQIIQPGDQDRIVLYYWESMKQKALLVTRGCHDDWDQRMADIDFVGACAAKAGALNFWHGGTLTLKLGSQTYTGHIRHKFKYESSLNTTNAQRRMMEIYGPADFAVLAHLHNPEINERHFMGAYRWFVRSGSYKVWDEFGQKVGGFKGKPGVPVLIFYPNERRIDGYKDLRAGVEALRHARGA